MTGESESDERTTTADVLVASVGVWTLVYVRTLVGDALALASPYDTLALLTVVLFALVGLVVVIQVLVLVVLLLFAAYVYLDEWWRYDGSVDSV